MRARALALVLAAGCLSGCASTQLRSARNDFYAGNLAQATITLSDAPGEDTDRVLLLMERGMVKQVAGSYRSSADDWVAAVEAIEELDKVSVSRQAASFVTSDNVKTFRGLPYERVLLHSFSALNYFALAMWDDAAVEARNIIARTDNLNGFPDDAYSHYLAAFSLELIGDSDGARRQYEATDGLTKTLAIGSTGRIEPSQSGKATTDTHRKADGAAELVCFVSIGRGPDGYGHTPHRGRWGLVPYVEIMHDGKRLGRTYALTDTATLYAATEAKLAALRAAKDITRLVVKHSLASSVSDDHPALGMLLWIALFAFEGQPDRRWETLPLSLQVGRVPCPDDLREVTLVYHGRNGAVEESQTYSVPLTRHRNVFVTFARNGPRQR